LSAVASLLLLSAPGPSGLDRVYGCAAPPDCREADQIGAVPAVIRGVWGNRPEAPVAGLHTGEVERRQSSVAGLAVHVGARVASLAAAGEVLVTSVVRALARLVLGSDRGIHSLKGVPDTWQLFAAI
jgi:class 3 adenylate cyclase